MQKQRDSKGRFVKRDTLRDAELRQIQRWADNAVPPKVQDYDNLTPTDLLFGAVCIILLSLAAAIICAALP